jgi:hypothetical protein
VAGQPKYYNIRLAFPSKNTGEYGVRSPADCRVGLSISLSTQPVSEEERLMMKAEQAWQAVLGQLEMEMPKASFDTWVRNADIVSYEDNVFIVGVSNAYARDWLESRLSSKIKRQLCGILNRTVSVRFIVWQAGADQLVVEPPLLVEEPEDPPIQYKNTAVINRYSFENFVSGHPTAWRMPPHWLWLNDLPGHTTRFSCMGGWGWGKPICCMPLAIIV